MEKELKKMTLKELRACAKRIGVKPVNVSKEQLIKKLAAAKAAAGTDKKTEKPSTISSLVSAIDKIGGARAAAKPLPPDTVIPVKSIAFGSVIYIARSDGKAHIWNDIGDVVEMTASEITEMNIRSPEFLKKPLLILLNDDAAKSFGLTGIYENAAMINELDTLLNSDLKTISRTLDNALSVNMRDIVISKVRSMYTKGRIKNIDVIKLLENKLKFDLTAEESDEL